MHVGVKCLPFTDACAVPVDKVITNVETPTACNCQQCTTPTPRSVISTSGTLGALIGLLAVTLVMVVTGWIVSCVYLQRKINK